MQLNRVALVWHWPAPGRQRRPRMDLLLSLDPVDGMTPLMTSTFGRRHLLPVLPVHRPPTRLVHTKHPRTDARTALGLYGSFSLLPIVSPMREWVHALSRRSPAYLSVRFQC